MLAEFRCKKGHGRYYAQVSDPPFENEYQKPLCPVCMLGNSERDVEPTLAARHTPIVPKEL